MQEEQEAGPHSPTNTPARPLLDQELIELEESSPKIIELDESAFKDVNQGDDEDVMAVEEVDELDEDLPHPSKDDSMADVQDNVEHPVLQETTIVPLPEQTPARLSTRTPSPIRVPPPFATSTPAHPSTSLPDLTGSLSKLLDLTRLSMEKLPQLLKTQKISPEFTELIQKLDSVLYPPKSEPDSIPSLRAQIETLRAEKIVLETDMGGIFVAF